MDDRHKWFLFLRRVSGQIKFGSLLYSWWQNSVRFPLMVKWVYPCILWGHIYLLPHLHFFKLFCCFFPFIFLLVRRGHFQGHTCLWGHSWLVFRGWHAVLKFDNRVSLVQGKCLNPGNISGPTSSFLCGVKPKTHSKLSAEPLNYTLAPSSVSFRKLRAMAEGRVQVTALGFEKLQFWTLTLVLGNTASWFCPLVTIWRAKTTPDCLTGLVQERGGWKGNTNPILKSFQDLWLSSSGTELSWLYDLCCSTTIRFVP